MSFYDLIGDVVKSNTREIPNMSFTGAYKIYYMQSLKVKVRSGDLSDTLVS